jgi:hypothetical protein
MHGLKNLAILLITIPGVTRGHVATSPTYDRKGRGVDHDNETEDAQQNICRLAEAGLGYSFEVEHWLSFS